VVSEKKTSVPENRRTKQAGFIQIIILLYYLIYFGGIPCAGCVKKTSVSEMRTDCRNKQLVIQIIILFNIFGWFKRVSVQEKAKRVWLACPVSVSGRKKKHKHLRGWLVRTDHTDLLLRI